MLARTERRVSPQSNRAQNRRYALATNISRVPLLLSAGTMRAHCFGELAYL
jgi:hypothetical protein